MSPFDVGARLRYKVPMLARRPPILRFHVNQPSQHRTTYDSFPREMLTAQLITPSRIVEARPGWDVPTKTRLDPIAGGDGPPAEPERAPGLGPVVNSTSGGAADVAGFIDALNALSAHIRDRERLEGEARRPWTLMAAAAIGLLTIQGLFALPLFDQMAFESRRYAGGDPTIPLALVASAGLTAILAAALFLRLATQSLRRADDSVERVALRHEDSPLRDRIRIAQWILLDTAFTRFCIAERSINARIAQGIFLISAWATLCVWLALAFTMLINTDSPFDVPPTPWKQPFMATLAIFLALTVASIFLTRRWGIAQLSHAQHFARQVQAFDRDFGGFLPRIERERVEKIVNARAGARPAQPNDESPP